MTLLYKNLVSLIRFTFFFAYVFFSTTLWGDALKIVAVVGSDPITMLDFQERLIFTIVTSGMQDSPETRRELSNQVLTALIDEKLKLKEAHKYKIDLSEKQIMTEWERIEKQNQVPPGAIKNIIRQLGFRESVFKDQIRADLSWIHYISARYRPTVTVSDHDINQVLQKFENAKNKARLLLNEIFIAFDSPSKRDEAFETAKNIVTQLRKGANFPALAREVSQGFTAEQGGDLGWIIADQLTKPLLNNIHKTLGEAVTSLSAKTISEPLETQDGFHIFFVREKLNPLDQNQKDESYKIRQIFVPFNPEMNPEDIQMIRRKLEQLRRDIRNPDDMLRAQKQIGGLQPPERWIQLSEFNERLRPEILKLPLNQVSPILELDNGLTFLMICNKKESMDINAKQREMIKEELISEKLAMFARRHLRDLKQSTHIDIRL